MTNLLVFILFLLFFDNCSSTAPTLTPVPNTPASVAENVVNVVLSVTWNPTDPDGGSAFSYSQDTSGPHSQYFRVNSADGKITVIRALDYEDAQFNGRAYVAVTVTDAQAETTTYNLTVTIIDQNEFLPRFPRSSYRANISEDHRVFSSILNLSAIDQDGGDFGVLNYVVRPPGAEYFRVDSLGLLIPFVSLDRERFRTLTFDVVTLDKSFNSSTASVTIILRNVNDNAPYFKTSVVNIEVSSNAELYTSVGKITAIDTDAEGTILTYRFYNNTNIDDHFIMGPMDGQITTNKKLEDGKTYSFRVQADDGGKPTPLKSNPVLVRIDTYNAEAYQTDWTISVPEGTVFTEDHHSQLMLKLLADQCKPCVPRLSKQTKDKDGNTVLTLYFLKDNATGSNNTLVGKRFMSKTEILDKWSDNNGNPNTNARSATPVPGTLLSVGQTIYTEPENWWLDTHEGRFCIFLICFVGLALLSTLIVFLLDWFWWSARPQRRFDRAVVRHKGPPPAAIPPPVAQAPPIFGFEREKAVVE